LDAVNSYETSGDLLTFVFADLAGFTALTEAHGDERAADLATEFCARIRDQVPDFGGEVVKTIGDAALIHCTDAGAAVELGLSILEDEGDRTEFPAVRIGMHSGVAIERKGDWFGSTVNVASRVAAVAAAGEVVLTQATFDLAAELEDVVFERLGSRTFKNVSDPVVLFRASRKGAHIGNVTVDPVCRMRIADEEWIGTLSFEGRVFRFCSMDCAKRFAADPERYANDAHSDHGGR
jgi:class 3 adenylate cyclase/YHS domain-containing protein